MDTNHRKLSAHQVLDDFGASEYSRQLFWDNAMIREIGLTVEDRISNPVERSIYHFGSFIEGTTIDGLKYDVDMMICHECPTVIENIEEARKGSFLLMVRDCNTKPGYVILQQVEDGILQFDRGQSASDTYESDHYDRICFKHLGLPSNELTTRNGPADTIPGGFGVMARDAVVAVRCKNVPSFGSSWVYRPRQCDWPSQIQLKKMSSYGCFLVGAAHPMSHTKSIEWRISFSLQERELMASLNPTQHTCYIVLKMIIQTLIEPFTGKAISSYHCKTCLFYTIESSSSCLWTPENLKMWVHRCLDCLLSWITKGHCPNYFIPDENMFDKLDEKTLGKVRKELSYNLNQSNDLKFVFQLENDKANRSLIKTIQLFGSFDNKMLIRYYHFLKKRVIYSVYDFRNYLLNCTAVESIESLLFDLEKSLQQLQLINQSRERSTKDVRMALSYMLPHIHLQIAQSTASVEVKSAGSHTYSLFPLTILNYLVDSKSDLISSKLSLAACLLHFGMLDACGHILLAAEDSLGPYILSVCPCNGDKRSCNHNIAAKTDALSTQDIIQKHITGCVVYLPPQANIVHPALQYEMYRAVYAADSLRHKSKDKWFDWIVLDSKVYMYFLQYIFCIKANKKPPWNSRAVDNLRRIIKEDTCLGHRETAYNVLGWILTQENQIHTAWRCLCWSWQFRPHHNAAKWHLVLLLSDLLH